MDDALVSLLAHQDGIVSREQLAQVGLGDADVARLVRHKQLVRVHRGVYAGQTGALTTRQRAWAAVLFSWPAALCHRTVLDWAESGRRLSDAEVHVAVAADRRVTKLPGVVVHRMKEFDSMALLNLSPPRVRFEQAVLDVAAGATSERRAVAVIADACQSRRTTADRLRHRLEQLPRLRHRRLLLMILDDVAVGAYSVLERLYLTRVERAHGLPSAQRQRRAQAGRATWFRDVEYVDQSVVVELDGRLGHWATDDRWADLDRDVAAATVHRITVRLGYGQVLQPCRVAAALARILHARGSVGRPTGCAPDCPVTAVAGEFHAPGEGNSPLTA